MHSSAESCDGKLRDCLVCFLLRLQPETVETTRVGGRRAVLRRFGVVFPDVYGWPYVQLAVLGVATVLRNGHGAQILGLDGGFRAHKTGFVVCGNDGNIWKSEDIRCYAPMQVAVS